MPVNSNESLPIFCPSPAEERFRQQPWSRSIVEGSKWRSEPQFALDEREQLCRSDGVTT